MYKTHSKKPHKNKEKGTMRKKFKEKMMDMK